MTKVLSYILIVAILFLLVKPKIDSIQLSLKGQQICCSSDKCDPIPTNDASDYGDTQDQKSHNMCNPFQACCTCLLICNIPPSYTIFTVEVFTEHFSQYQSILPSQFIPDFWQPPKFV